MSTVANGPQAMLAHLNTCDEQEFIARLGSIYEHSPWVAQAVFPARPFASLAALKYQMQNTVLQASQAQQLALIRAHPELAGKAAIAGELGAESRGEQALVGLHLCSAEEFARLQELNADYKRKFDFPFIVAVKGDNGRGLTRTQIISTFARRLQAQVAQEQRQALHEIGRIAEMRLNALFGAHYQFGQQIMDGAETLAAFSDDSEVLTCAWLTPAHQACAQQILQMMQAAGMQAEIDAVGNVVGRYLAADGKVEAPTLMTGSHYDTVRNGGKYDGRLGVLLPIAVVQYLHQTGQRLPFNLEVVAFADEEGVRYQTTFLGSKALTGKFDLARLDAQDANGVTMQQALQAAGHQAQQIPALRRDPASLLGFVEVHIEQGPVLLEHGLALGVVTSIAGSSRYLLHLEGEAGHAGTTPMQMRRDAAAAAAEIVLMVEKRAKNGGDLVGTVGQLQVPAGSVNVIPGACQLSLDIRSGDDAQRQQAVQDILQQAQAICLRRGILLQVQSLLQQAAVQCAPRLRQGLANAVQASGLPLLELPSGAGHDAMCVAEITEVGMLFVRCGNRGISHHPLESLNADDAEIAAQVFLAYLQDIAAAISAK